MTTPTTTSSLFSNLLTQLGDDLFVNGQGLLTAFFTNIQANPSTQSVIAQAAILAATAPLQLPNLEKDAISQVAATGLQLVQQLTPPTPTPVPTPPVA